MAAEIGVGETVAQLMLDTEMPVPVAIDDHVIADEQRVADLYLAARIIHTRVDARTAFDPSFNVTLSG